MSIEHSYFHSHYSNRHGDLTRWLNCGTGRTGVFIMAQSLVPARAKVDPFPSALCVRLTWIGLWCRGQVGTELLGSQRGIKDKPLRRPEHSGRFILVTICIQKINDFLFHLVYELSWMIVENQHLSHLMLCKMKNSNISKPKIWYNLNYPSKILDLSQIQKKITYFYWYYSGHVPPYLYVYTYTCVCVYTCIYTV